MQALQPTLQMQKLIRITTIPLSLEKLLEGQLSWMNKYYEVVAVAAEKPRLHKYGRDNDVATYWVELTRAITPIKDLKATWKLFLYFRKEKPLIVHTHTPKAGIIGMFAAWLARVPIRLHTVAGLPLLETAGFKRKILNFVEKLTYKFAVRIYPNSYGLKEIILREDFVKESKMKVLGNGSSNGINTEYFNPENYSVEMKINLKNDLNIPHEDLVYIFIGRLVSEKGINELVEAFVILNRELPATSLLLIGPFEQELDPLRPETLEIIKTHSKIFTTGYQVDVRPYLAISDILTFPSYREGFPNVVLQAGAMNLPAIVSDINGCNEIIQDGLNGIIIPVKNSEALLEAMKNFYTNNDLRQKLELNTRDLIKRNYERIVFWQILLKEYKELELSVEHN